MSADVGPVWRVPLLIMGMVSLVLGVAAGLFRLGWNVLLPSGQLALLHGPLMISGFFGTVISLERAVALRHRWAYLGPLLSGLGGLGLIFGMALPAPSASLAAGSLVLLAGSLNVYIRQRALFTLTLALGAAAWLGGNLLWLGGLPVHAVVPWWMAFLVLTIAGERLELSRFLPPSPAATRLFAVIVSAMLTGIGLSLIRPSFGTLLFAAALLALSVWLLHQDIARRTVKQQGLTRFIAVCLLSGYGWLAVGALLALVSGGLMPGGASYDAALHAVLLGFVFSMVFGHAPIIFPAVLRAEVPYYPAFYLPLIVLHASVFIRLAGDVLGAPEVRGIGGMLNAAALLLFIIGTVSAIVLGAAATKTRRAG